MKERENGAEMPVSGPASADVTIIIVSWNTRDMLAACLQSLRDCADGLRLQTLVVDNDSHDGSRDMMAACFPEVEAINSGANIGFGRANNLVLPRVRSPRVLFLNPDTELRPGALRAMVDCLEARPGLGAVGCRLTDAAGRTQPLGLQVFPTPFREFVRLAFYTESLGRKWPGLFHWRDAEQSGFVVKIYGACLLVRREVLDRIGGFDDRYFMYCEDVDFCRRILEAGWKLYYLNNPAIIHHGAAASAKAPGAFSVLMTCQSIALYMRKYYGWPGSLAHRLLVLLAALLRLLMVGLIRLTGRRAGDSGRPLAHLARRDTFLLRWALGLEKARVAAG